MNIPLIMVVLYLLVTTVIGMSFAKKNQNSNQYFVADRSLGIVLIASLLFSEIIAGAGTIGNAASAYQGGLSSVWANWGMCIGCIIFIPLVGKFYRAMAVRHNVQSVPKAYACIFDKRSQILMVVIISIAYVIMYSTQAMAAAAIIAPLLGVEAIVIVWVCTGLFILVTVTGGMKGIAWMNVLHSAVMYLGMFIVAFRAVSSVGGIEVLRASVPSEFFSLTQPNLHTTIANALGTAISFLASANVANATFSAKSLRISNRGILLAGLVVVPFAVCPAIIGICANVALPGISPNNALFSMANSLGSLYGGAVSMAIIAAIWSTAPALLLIISTTMTRDLFKGYLYPQATDLQQMWFSRIVAVVVGVTGTAVGFGASSILDQMLGAFQIRSIVGIVLAVAVFWPRVNKDAAFWSMLGGGAVAVYWQFGGQPFGIAPIWPGALVCLLIMVPITLASREKVSPGFRLYSEAVKEMENMESEASGLSE